VNEGAVDYRLIRGEEQDRGARFQAHFTKHYPLPFRHYLLHTNYSDALLLAGFHVSIRSIDSVGSDREQPGKDQRIDSGMDSNPHGYFNLLV
jgi:hypothetical protein